MPKPQENTPVAHTLSLLKALPGWHATHAESIKDGLDEELDPAVELPAKTTALTQAQETFEREQKEDAAATLQVDALITEGIALLTSVGKTVQATLRKHPQRARLTRQILEDAPSDHRTAIPLLGALKLAHAGLQQHADLFSKRRALHGRLTQRAATLITSLSAAHDLRKQEQVESRAARTARDQALTQALDLITALDDGAQAVYFEATAPWNTLRVLYEVHCPTPPPAADKDKDKDDDPTEPEGDGTGPTDDPT